MSSILPTLGRTAVLAVLALAIAPAHALPTPPLPDALIPEQESWAKNHPRVVLDAAGVARVKQAIQDDPEIAALWNKLKARCDAYTDPQSPDYIDASKAYAEYLSLQGGSHEKQAGLEGAARKWLTPLDLLNFAYAVSGDKRYGMKAVELALATAQKLKPEAMEAGFFYTRTFPVRSMALALDWCYPLFTSDQRQIVRRSLIDHTNTLYFQSLNSIWGQTSLGRVWNWNGGTASTWGLAALVLNGETHAPTRQWIFQAARNVEDYLRFGIDAQGGVIEGPSYFSYGAGYLPYFVEGLRSNMGEDLYKETNYQHFAAWLPMEILPGGDRVNNIEDSGFGPLADAPLYALYRETDRPLARYLWEQLFTKNLADAVLPSEILWAPEPVAAAAVAARAAQLPGYGWAGGRSLVVSRSGWGADDAYFSLHAQHYTALRHDQADKGQFTLYAYGDDLAIDSGYGNDASKEKSTSGFAHNQVMVDGQPELQGGYHAQTDGWVVDSLHASLLDLACVDIVDAYRFFYDADMSYKETHKQDFQRADRHTLFVRAPFPYAVVFDDVKKDAAAHDYTWMLHAKAGKTFERAGNGIRVVPAQTEPETVVFRPIPSQDPSHNATPGGGSKWEVTVQVPTAGKYRVWGLTGTANPDGEKSDSVSFQINKGKQGFTKGGQGGTGDRFVWATWPRLPLSWTPLNDDNGATPVPALDFESGPVTFDLYDRESGADCAAIALLPESMTPPAAGGPLPDGAVVARASEGDISGAMQRQQIAFAPQNAWLQVGFVTPDQWQEKIESFQTTRDGVHPRLSVTQHADDGQFLTFLVPHRLKDNKPGDPAEIQPASAQKGHAGTLAVQPGLTDLVACWDGKTGIALPDIETDAELLWLRRDDTGRIVAAAASNLTRLTLGGHPVFTSNGSKTCFVLDGSHASVPDDADVKFDLPGAAIEIEKVKRPTDWFSSRPSR